MIYSAYCKAPMFENIYPALRDIYHAPCDGTLIEFNLRLLKFIGGLLNIATPIQFSSSFGIQAQSSEKLINLVHAVNGEKYLTGFGSKNYLDEMMFSTHGVAVIWHQFVHPVYKQLHSSVFTPNLSIIDVLMNIPAASVTGFLQTESKEKNDGCN